MHIISIPLYHIFSASYLWFMIFLIYARALNVVVCLSSHHGVPILLHIFLDEIPLFLSYWRNKLHLVIVYEKY